MRRLDNAPTIIVPPPPPHTHHHSPPPPPPPGLRQVLDRLAEELDSRGGRLALVVAGRSGQVEDQILSHSGGALGSRIRRRFHLPDLTDEASEKWPYSMCLNGH